MILIYADFITPRLHYIASFIFGEQFTQPFRITTDENEFVNYSGVKISYSGEHHNGDWFSIPATGLVFEKGIRPVDVLVSEWENCPVLFSGGQGNIPFDIFSAVFFCLSRYEEYWSFDNDVYGRYPHTESIAFRYDFLHLPLVNIWLTLFSNELKKKYPGLELPRPPFRFQPTYDIDIAWSYRQKGFLRNIGGFLKNPSMERLKVLAGSEKDPFDSYDWLDRIHDHYELKPVYFFLVAALRSRYDKNIPPDRPAMKQLIDRHARKYEVGLHPSWSSHEHPALISAELHVLSRITGKQVTHSRQHYIRFQTPGTFRQLIEAGITDEYSMGYGSINGFRASVASPYYWYDIERESKTELIIHPFCYMDANALYEQKQDTEISATELRKYYAVCQQHHGELVTVFHNQFMGTDPAFAGWPQLYEDFIAQVRQ